MRRSGYNIPARVLRKSEQASGLAEVFQVFPKRPGNEARLTSDFLKRSWFC